MTSAEHEQNIVKKPFIFVSYQHNDQDLVAQDIQWFEEKGVRIWYDTNLDYGDDWKKRVERVISHANCCGVLFYSSTTALHSDPIHFERGLALQQIRYRQENSFFYLPVYVGKPSMLQLIRQTFLEGPDDPKQLDIYFSSTKLSLILELFPAEVLGCYADQSHRDHYLSQLLETLEKKAPDAIDTQERKVRKAQESTSNFQGLSTVSLGTWRGERAELPSLITAAEDRRTSYKSKDYIITDHLAFLAAPMQWLWLKTTPENRAILLCDAVVDVRKADAGLNDWLQDVFRAVAFTPQEQALLAAPVRLLSQKDVDLAACRNQLQDPPGMGCSDFLYWWLSDKAMGNSQKVVKAKDGTVYANGLPRIKAVGIRPVIEIDLDKLIQYLED